MIALIIWPTGSYLFTYMRATLERNKKGRQRGNCVACYSAKGNALS
jgi:hypothetical protein